MDNFLSSILLFSTALLGGTGVILFGFEKKIRLNLLISFSGAFLFTICISHLLPEVFSGESERPAYFILAGFFIQLILEFFSKGIEHGHAHHHGEKNFPLALFLSLCLHALIEGMPLSGEFHFRSQLLIGIILHNIPITIVLSSLLLSRGLSKRGVTLSIFIFSIMAPIGMLCSTYIYLSDLITDYLHLILSLIIGMLLHISTTILFESSTNHKIDAIRLLSIITGVVLALMI